MIERKRCPAHPGRILKNLYLTPLEISITDLAKGLGVSRKTVSAIINERKSVTPEMALRLSKALPNSTPESWLNLQRNYDLWQTSHRTFAWKSVQAIDYADARP
jgi:addiction module HigA family antidote